MRKCNRLPQGVSDGLEAQIQKTTMAVFAQKRRIDHFKTTRENNDGTSALTDLDDAVMGIITGDEQHRNRELFSHLVPVAGGMSLDDVVASSTLEIP